MFPFYSFFKYLILLSYENLSDSIHFFILSEIIDYPN